MHIFKEEPPADLILKFIQGFGLKSLNDQGWFSKDHVRLDILDTFLIELEPYYLPCKATTYLHESLTPLRAITILRQLLKTQNISLKSCERGRNNIKTVWYHIQPRAHLEADGKIVFN